MAAGDITVRNSDAQTQDVATLSRDTDNANGSIDKIFDKDNVASQMAFAQGVAELGMQFATDLSRNHLEAAQAKVTASEAYKNAKTAEEREQLIANDPTYQEAMKTWGTGGTFSMAAAAVTAAFSGMSVGNLGAAASGAMAPYLANAIKQATTSVDPLTGKETTNLVANTMAHAVAGAVLAQLSGNSATGGAVGAASGELIARGIAATLYPGRDPGSLTQDEKDFVSALSQMAGGLAAGMATDSTAGGTAGQIAGKNAVENNSLAGDIARESVKQSAEWWKDQVRDKLGEGTTSAIANSIINVIADNGDVGLGSADYVVDTAMALASCAAGDSYCSQALNDLSGKNQAVADRLKALMKSETWSAMAGTMKEAAKGNQAALEATGGMLASVFMPGKKLPGVVKAVDPTIKIATGITVGEFEASLFKLPAGERVAIVKQTAAKVIVEQKMVKDNKLTKINNRDVYRGQDGNLYALDTQHGRFEVVSPQGKHINEINFAMKDIPDSHDKSGGHNLKVK